MLINANQSDLINSLSVEHCMFYVSTTNNRVGCVSKYFHSKRNILMYKWFLLVWRVRVARSDICLGLKGQRRHRESFDIDCVTCHLVPVSPHHHRATQLPTLITEKIEKSVLKEKFSKRHCFVRH